jgi:hypothetical protein
MSAAVASMRALKEEAEVAKTDTLDLIKKNKRSLKDLITELKDIKEEAREILVTSSDTVATKAGNRDR